MAWAMGASANPFPGLFHQFNAAMNAGQFAAAIPFAGFQGTGVASRIAQNKVRLANAQAVLTQGRDPSILYWPQHLSTSPPAPVTAPTSTGLRVIEVLVGVSAAISIAAAVRESMRQPVHA